jgi:hypothetical protein
MSVAVFGVVLTSKQILRSAMLGFVLGIVVMTGVAVMSRKTSDPPGQSR